MHVLDLTLPRLEENLALDEALLLAAEAGGPDVLRFWEWTGVGVVIGAGGRWREEAQVEACESDGVAILRRSSGGGSVVLGRGCLLYSLVLAYDRDPALADLHASYRLILETIAGALAPLAPGIVPAGISDLAVGDRKCSGNSQQRKRSHLLHHGTLLCSFDLEQISRYLAHPPREPEYRQHRGHLEFVANLSVAIPRIKQALQHAWQANEPMSTLPHDRTQSLLDEKYARREWHRRR